MAARRWRASASVTGMGGRRRQRRRRPPIPAGGARLAADSADGRASGRPRADSTNGAQPQPAAPIRAARVAASRFSAVSRPCASRCSSAAARSGSSATSASSPLLRRIVVQRQRQAARAWARRCGPAARRRTVPAGRTPVRDATPAGGSWRARAPAAAAAACAGGPWRLRRTAAAVRRPASGWRRGHARPLRQERREGRGWCAQCTGSADCRRVPAKRRTPWRGLRPRGADTGEQKHRQCVPRRGGRRPHGRQERRSHGRQEGADPWALRQAGRSHRPCVPRRGGRRPATHQWLRETPCPGAGCCPESSPANRGWRACACHDVVRFALPITLHLPTTLRPADHASPCPRRFALPTTLHLPVSTRIRRRPPGATGSISTASPRATRSAARCRRGSRPASSPRAGCGCHSRCG